MAVANLPPELRYVSLIYILACSISPFSTRWDPENVILIGTIPGPTETKTDQLSNFLAPLVDELLALWETPRTIWTPSKLSAHDYHFSILTLNISTR
jgi:hypothetical protein